MYSIIKGNVKYREAISNKQVLTIPTSSKTLTSEPYTSYLPLANEDS